ncbi:MAG TPA: glycerophosphodiester phosphodiesterase family protein [Bryobacteraceae bacterium]|jgi:glycerophosphoryl diester phosphodiesterase
MNRFIRTMLVAGLATAAAEGGILARGARPRMMCHRTANRDMPENTLESLALAARMGCSVVEIDVRRTLDGELVLNHDGMLERLTDGMGDVEQSYFEQLNHLDAGSWMGTRFANMRIPRLTDALAVAREQEIGLVLDLKAKDMGPAVLALLRREGMLKRVRFGGEWTDVKALYPAANEDAAVSIEPTVTREQVEKLHEAGKIVIANFSANSYEMDLPAMRSAATAGVDWINVDYPRLGADTLGQPVESKIASLVAKANTGTLDGRAAAILELGHYHGFHLHAVFLNWLQDSEDRISRAAATALVTTRPPVPAASLVEALQSKQATARKNAAWALGALAAPATDSLQQLLNDTDAGVLQEALLALSRCPGMVSANRLLPLLSNNNAAVRGAAALALARHQPEVAASAIPKALAHEEDFIAKEYSAYVEHGKPPRSQAEIDVTVEHYRCLMKLIEAGSMLSNANALKLFEREAFRSAPDYSPVAGLVAGYQLWDRAGEDPTAIIQALGSSDVEIANRAEWILVKAGPAVLPTVRQALSSEMKAVRERSVRILAWQGDSDSTAALQAMKNSGAADPALIDWAIGKIRSQAFGGH